MLLRRITEHVKDQNWFAVLIDFVIVVFGVFIGIQVSNWNNYRQQSVLKSLTYDRISADFVYLDEQLDMAVQDMEKRLFALEVLRNAISVGSVQENEQEEILYAIGFGQSYTNFLGQSSTYEELLSSGNLQLIEDAILRAALSNFYHGQQRRTVNLQQIRDAMHKTQKSEVLRRYAKLEPLRVDGEMGNHVLRYQDFNFDQMLADPDLKWTVENTLLHQSWVYSNVRSSRQGADEVLAILEKN